MSDLNDSGRDFSRWRFVVFVLVICLYLSGMNPHWRISPDSGRYLTMARQLAEGKGYEYCGMSQYGIPPGLPALYAALFRMSAFDFSVESVTSALTVVNAAGAAFGILGVFAAYLLVRDMSGRGPALVTAAIVAVSRYYFGNAFDALTDVPYCAVSWAAIWLVSRRESIGVVGGIAAAALLAACVLLRAVGLALVAAVAVPAVVRLFSSEAGVRRAALARLAVALPAWGVLAFFAAAYVSAANNAAFSYYSAHVAGRPAWEVLSTASRDGLRFGAFLFKLIAGCSSVLGLWMPLAALIVTGAMAAWRRRHRIIVLYCLFYLGLVATIPDDLGLEVRITIPLLAPVCMLAWEGLKSLGSALESKAATGRLVRVRRACCVIAVTAIVCINLGNDAKLLAENLSPDFYANYARGKWADYVALGRHAASLGRTGRVMAAGWGPVRMLADWEAVRPLYRVAENELPPETLKAYLKNNDIRTAIEDTDHPDDASATRQALAKSGAFKWKELASFGRLVVYSIEEEGPPGRSGPE